MTDAPPLALPLTGERTVPGIPRENYWFRRHEVVYRALAPRCADVRVLEAGCGEGYGADLLADVARSVLALDYDIATAAHVRRRYPRVAVARANLVALPVRDGSCDAVVSLQVIEHLWEQDRFLRECVRVLTPGGLLAVSTPNRLTFSPGRDTPLNPFHTRELSAAELRGLVVEAGFVDVEVLGLHHGPGLGALDVAHGGSLVDAQVAVALSGGSWPERLRRDVASVTCADFTLSPGGNAATSSTHSPLDGRSPGRGTGRTTPAAATTSRGPTTPATPGTLEALDLDASLDLVALARRP